MSTDGSTGTDSGEPAHKARTAAEQRQDAVATSDDPEVLTAEIERTREELAETLDAIADKVSPKRVVGRTKKKVGAAVKDGADGAAATIKSSTAAVKEAAVEAKEAVEDKMAATKDDGPQAPGPVSATPNIATPTTATPTTAPLGGTAPTYPPLRPVPAQSSSLLAPPALAGAVAAVVVALLLLRRRRR